MQIIATLLKPFTKKQKYDFIVEYNHNHGFAIKEDNKAIYAVKEDKPILTYEEIRQLRASAYREEVDPITCNIDRLRDEEQTEETIAEIESLKQERSLKVQEIKERFPYSTDQSEESYS